MKINASRSIHIFWLVVSLLVPACADQESAQATTGSTDIQRSPARAEGPVHRALLVGINDYSASGLTYESAGASAPANAAKEGARSSWPNLKGSVNDVMKMRQMLVAGYGFQETDIELLTDKAATRDAILAAIRKYLVEPAQESDIILFYYSGHGSQVVNSMSEEPDKKDESLVPADSRVGAPDIRDKELRLLFNEILDRKAHLTVILDSCHSGSGARGYPDEAIPRGLATDLRDVRDGSDDPAPEERGALVLSAAQDFEFAWETLSAGDGYHGVFSLALFHAMRSPTGSVSAEQMFLQAQARVRGQEPVIAGIEEVRRAALFGGRSDVAGDKAVVAVKDKEPGGSYLLAGGWANGLGEGSELHQAGTEGAGGVRLKVTDLINLSQARAEVVSVDGVPDPPVIEIGTLFEIASWVPPPGRPLRVWMPRASDDALKRATALAEQLASEQEAVWTEGFGGDPPTHVLRWQGAGWRLIQPETSAVDFPAGVSADQVRSKLEEGARFFVELPVPDHKTEQLTIGPDTENDAVQPVDDPEDADYVLAGRWNKGEVEYAWVRTRVVPASDPHRREAMDAASNTGSDQDPQTPASTRPWQESTLPPRSDWHSPTASNALKTRVQELEEAALRLAKIHAWDTLESPADFPYRLELREKGGEPVTGNKLHEKGQYGLALRLPEPSRKKAIIPHYVYVFVINSYGDSVLLFPASNVENRFPLSGAEPPVEIPLGPQPLFEIVEPFGIDNYFLLATVDPIPNPWVLSYPGVRTRGPKGRSALEELLSQTGSATRNVRLLATPLTWSLSRLAFESVFF